MQHRADEFSLHIRYRRRNSGSYPRVDIEGFYLTTGFANEGEADWLANEVLLSPWEFKTIMATIQNTLGANRSGSLLHAANKIADSGVTQMREQLNSTYERINKLTDEAAALKEALNRADFHPQEN